MQTNEAEKIELELPEGEVDIHEADVDDSIIEEKPVVEAKPKDELDEISDSVQKRIDKLTYKLSRVSAEAENLRRLSAQQQVQNRNREQQAPVESYQPTLQPQASGPDPKAERWAAKNTWFGDDQAMTFAAFGIHKELVEGGIDPTSDTYYSEVDKKMQENFPHRFTEEQAVPVQQVAASSRGASGRKSSRKIKLSPSQVAIAKRLNVPLEEYAKHVERV